MNTIVKNLIFKSPEADYAVLPLMGVAFLTNIPLYALFLIGKLISLIKSKMNKNKKIETKLNEEEMEELKSEEKLESSTA